MPFFSTCTVCRIARSGFAFKIYQHWRDRPRLRVTVRSVGIMDEDRDLVFEATNVGGRLASLVPVVKMRGLWPFQSKRRWFPIPRVARPVTMLLDIVEDDTRLEPHATRVFRARSGAGQSLEAFCCTYTFRLAGSRPYRDPAWTGRMLSTSSPATWKRGGSGKGENK